MPHSPAATIAFRNFCPADLPAIAQAMGDARVTRFYGLETTHDAPGAIAQEQLDWFAALAADGDGWWQAVWLEGALAGAIGVYERDDEGDSAELGYWLLPHYWGRDLMRQALRLWLPQAFRQLRLHSVVAYTEPENTASMQLLRGAGFVHEGLLRECTKRGDRYVSLHRFSLLARELGAAAPRT